MVGRLLIEEWARLPVDIEYASEFRYRFPVLDESTLAIAVSQSGETADTIAAQRVAREGGALTLAICNHMGSQLTREADGTLYTRSGREICVAATKTFTSQIMAFTLLALHLAELRGTLAAERIAELRAGIDALPELAARLLAEDSPVWAQTERIAAAVWEKEFFLYIGRHLGMPVCLEGALKLKEISYIPTDSYAAGEMKHGPIALLSENTPGRRGHERLARVREGRLERAGGAGARRSASSRSSPRATRTRRTTPTGRCRSRAPSPSSRRSWRRSRCRSWPTASRACAACRSISRGTSRRPSPSSSRWLPMTAELRRRMAELPFRELYEVGGSLRDELLGREPKDIDFLVRGHDVEELLALCRAARQGRGAARRRAPRRRALLAAVGAARGHRGRAAAARDADRARASRTTRGNPHTDFRIEPDAELPVRDDLERRDFTVNAMARDVRSGEWIDPFGGRDDLRARVLRAVHETAFRDDPLRILRGVARCSSTACSPTRSRAS